MKEINLNKLVEESKENFNLEYLLLAEVACKINEIIEVINTQPLDNN